MTDGAKDFAGIPLIKSVQGADVTKVVWTRGASESIGADTKNVPAATRKTAGSSLLQSNVEPELLAAVLTRTAPAAAPFFSAAVKPGQKPGCGAEAR